MPSGDVVMGDCRRINVIGTSGSGKSTFAQQLADRLSLPYIEMDRLFWQPNWTETPNEQFFAELTQALAQHQQGWVLDGNYSRTTAIKWQHADTVVWIHYSFPRTLFQVTKRAIVRSFNRKELWLNTGNVETLRNTFFSKKSIIWWVINNYKRQEKKYDSMMQSEKYAHIQFIELTSPKAARRFLATLGHYKTIIYA